MKKKCNKDIHLQCMMLMIYTHSDPLSIVPSPQMNTPIASHSEMTNKRTFSDVMEIEHEDDSITSNKQKVEMEGEMVKVIETKGEKKR